MSAPPAQSKPQGLFDIAFDEADRIIENGPDDEWVFGFGRGAEWAAGWMVALVGMATAIRARRWKCPTCRCSPSILTSTCSCCESSKIYDAIDEEPFI